MKHCLSFLIIFLFTSSQFSGYCTDNGSIDEKEKLAPTFRTFKKPSGTKTWQELSSQPSSISSNIMMEESPSRQIQLRDKVRILNPMEEEEVVLDEDVRQSSRPQHRTDNSDRDREEFYDKYGIHFSFQPNVELKFSRDESEYWNRSYVVPDSLLRYIWNLYYKDRFFRLEEEIRERDNVLKELESNGKSVSETFFLKEKAYKERIRLLEETIERGKESFHHIRSDRSDILEDKDKIISIQRTSIQEKSDLEKEALKKVKAILKLLGENETEDDILLSLDLLQKRLLQK